MALFPSDRALAVASHVRRTTGFRLDYGQMIGMDDAWRSAAPTPWTPAPLASGIAAAFLPPES